MKQYLRHILKTTGQEQATASLDGLQYQAWVDWTDPADGSERGVPREETRINRNGEIVVKPASPRFVEMTVNCDKSLSVAAALDPAVSVALDGAQAAAGEAMNRYMAQNSVTRIGARGAQRLVPVERLESVAVVHRSSRAGDPHRHVHVQWSTRVFAEGKWRGLHTAATLKQQGALRGVGEAAIYSDERLQAALARAGFAFDPASGKVTNLARQARAMSKRATQIQANVARFESDWRKAHPLREPDAALRREWDQKAWAHERPRKRQAGEHAETKWIADMRGDGLQVDGFSPVDRAPAATLDQLDRAAVAEQVVTVAGSKKSAWSLADLEGHIGVAVGQAGVRARPEEVTVFARALASEIAVGLPQLTMHVPGQVPMWVRHLTSERVQRVEGELRAGFTARGLDSGLAVDAAAGTIEGLNAEQTAAARALATAAPLVVIEGAAGAGKTTMLAAARDLAAANGTRFLVLAPTLRAANEAATAIGAEASSAHKLAHAQGFRWDEDGRWTRLTVGDVDPATGETWTAPAGPLAVDASTRIVIDEAGMLDQDLAHAVLTVADEHGATLALIGDRAQLSAVGRGGVLDMAVAAHPRPLDLSELHRFREAGYAALTLQMRDREQPAALFDDLEARGNIRVHDSTEEAWAAITSDVVARAAVGASVAVAVTTNEQAAEVNALVQAAHADAGRTRKPGVEVTGADGLTLRVGDRLMTRRNDADLGVANRDTWTIERVHADGSVAIAAGAREATLPRDYVEEHTHLAYAATEYGVQGATVDYGHGLVSDSSSAQHVYVAATRGREHNALHIVAVDRAEAREMFAAAMGREAGDRGIEAAAAAAARDVEGLILPKLDHDPQVRAARLAAEERVFQSEMRAWEAAQTRWEARHPDVPAADYTTAVAAAEISVAEATAATAAAEQAVGAEAIAAGEQAWTADYGAVRDAEAAVASASVLRRAAAQRQIEAAQAAFQARHQSAPAPAPDQAQRGRWRRAAVAAGTDARLDAARAAEQAAVARRAGLISSPAPGSAPKAPRPGTAQEEAAKDRVFQVQQTSWKQQQTAAAEQPARTQQQRPPEKSPAAER